MVTRGHSWSLVVTRGHSWSFVVTRGHSWSLVVIRGHSWSFVVTRGHSCVLLDKIHFDCDWFISVRLIPNHNAILWCQNSTGDEIVSTDISHTSELFVIIFKSSKSLSFRSCARSQFFDIISPSSNIWLTGSLDECKSCMHAVQRWQLVGWIKGDRVVDFAILIWFAIDKWR